MRSILGLTRPRRGAIRFDGRDVTRTATHEIARAGIGWVPDDRRLCPTLTVARNLAIAQKRTRFRAWSVKETTEIFSPLEYLMERDCENLSGGEMQMVAIARALVGAPGLVLFDEPSQGLAPKIVGDVLATVRRLKSEGVASLIVEQNAEIAPVGRRPRRRHRPRPHRLDRRGRRAARRHWPAPAPARSLKPWPRR